MFLTTLSDNRQLNVGDQEAKWSRLNEIHVQITIQGQRLPDAVQVYSDVEAPLKS